MSNIFELEKHFNDDFYLNESEDRQLKPDSSG